MRIVELKIPQNMGEVSALMRVYPMAALLVHNAGWWLFLLLLWATGHIV